MRWTDSLPRWLLVASGVFLGAGAVVIVAGLWLDGSAWWAERPFATNLVSSLAGAFVGIPMSVVVLAAVLDRAREHRIRFQVHATSTAAVADLVQISTRMFVGRRALVGGPLADWTVGLDEAVAGALTHLHAVRNYRDSTGIVKWADERTYDEAVRWLAGGAPTPRGWPRLAREAVAADYTLQGAVRLAEFSGMVFLGRVTADRLHAAVTALADALPANAEDRALEIAFRGEEIYSAATDLAAALDVADPSERARQRPNRGSVAHR